jgi:hypothetical protein
MFYRGRFETTGGDALKEAAMAKTKKRAAVRTLVRGDTEQDAPLPTDKAVVTQRADVSGQLSHGAAFAATATEEKRGLEVAETKPAETIVETTIIDAGFVALLLTRLAWDLAFFGHLWDD